MPENPEYGRWIKPAPRYPQSSSGLLASSPDDFQGSSEIIEILPEDMSQIISWPYSNYDCSSTNDGIRIGLPLEVDHSIGVYVAYLRCRVGPDGGVIAIYLDRYNRRQFTRVSPYDLVEFPTSYTSRMQKIAYESDCIYIKKRPTKFRSMRSTPSPTERVMFYLNSYDASDSESDDHSEERRDSVLYLVHDLSKTSSFILASHAPEQSCSIGDPPDEVRTYTLRGRCPQDFANHLSCCVVYADQTTQDEFLVALGLRMDENMQASPWVYVYDISDCNDLTAESTYRRWHAETRDNVREANRPPTFDRGVSFGSFMSRMLGPEPSEHDSENTEEQKTQGGLEPTWAVTALRCGKRVTANIIAASSSDRETTGGDIPAQIVFDVHMLVQ